MASTAHLEGFNSHTAREAGAKGLRVRLQKKTLRELQAEEKWIRENSEDLTNIEDCFTRKRIAMLRGQIARVETMLSRATSATTIAGYANALAKLVALERSLVAGGKAKPEKKPSRAPAAAPVPESDVVPQ